MGAVYPLFEALRKRLSTDQNLKGVLNKRIYFNLPARPTYPYVIFNVDEIIDTNDVCAIKFNLKLFSLVQEDIDPLKISRDISTILEVESLRLDATTKAMCRKTSTIFDFPAIPKPHVVQHFYHALVWRNRND